MLDWHWQEQVFTVTSSGYFCMLFDIQQGRWSPSSHPFPANYQSLLSTGLQGPAQVSPKDCPLTLTFCGSKWKWKIAAALTRIPGSHRDLTLLPRCGTMGLDRPGPHLASDPQRGRQAVAHPLTLNRKETVNVNEVKKRLWVTLQFSEPELNQNSHLTSSEASKETKQQQVLVNSQWLDWPRTVKEYTCNLLDLKNEQFAKKHGNLKETLL